MPVNSQWIRNRICEMRLTHQEVAEELELHPALISQILAGVRKPKLQEATTLATILHVDLAVMLSRLGLEIPDGFCISRRNPRVTDDEYARLRDKLENARKHLDKALQCLE